MGGLLCAYVSTNKLAQAQKGGFGTWLRAYVIYLLNRWCRLTPVLLITMFVQVAIIPTLGNGPIADSGAFEAAVSSVDYFNYLNFFLISRFYINIKPR